jgi:hypothetical protein
MSLTFLRSTHLTTKVKVQKSKSIDKIMNGRIWLGGVSHQKCDLRSELSDTQLTVGLNHLGEFVRLFSEG